MGTGLVNMEISEDEDSDFEDGPPPESGAYPDATMTDPPAGKFDRSALHWRILHIRQQRQQIWERRQAKLDSIRSKSKLMSKTALMAGAVGMNAPAASRMRLQELDEAAPADPVSDAPVDAYWSSERGLHKVSDESEPQRPMSSKKKPAPDWKDKYLMYPTIALSAIAMSSLFIVLLWHSLLHGWIWTVLHWCMRLSISISMSFVFVVLVVLLYEHATQLPGPAGTSLSCIAGYTIALPVALLAPRILLVPLAAIAVMGFAFKVLGIVPAPGATLPLAILPLLAMALLQLEPSAERLGRLLLLEAKMCWYT